MEYLDSKKNILISFIVFTILVVASLVSVEALTPNDPKFNLDTWDENNPEGRNWGQEFVKLPSAWDIETGSINIKVAVVDDGFDVTHEDLEENIGLIGFETLTRSHGTHVAGIIGAKGNNEKGIAGIQQLGTYPEVIIATYHWMDRIDNK